MSTEERKVILAEAKAAVVAGNYGDAERLAYHVLANSDPQREADSAQHSAALQQLGSIALLRENYPEALARFTAALSLTERFSNQTEMARALCNVGSTYMYLSEYRKACEHYDKALGIYDVIGNKEDAGTCLGNIGNVHSRLTDYTTALEYYQKALSIAEELGDKQARARHLGNMASSHIELSNYSQAIQCCREALRINEDLGNKLGVAHNVGVLGRVYSELSDYPSALECYGNSVRLYEELGSKTNVAILLSSIGVVHKELSDYSRALEYYNKALLLFEELEERTVAAATIGNIGNVYEELCNYPLALEYLNTSLNMNEARGDKNGMAIRLGNIGEVCEKQGDFNRALEYYGRALQLHEELGRKREAAYVRCSLGALYAKAEWSGRDEEKAEAYLLESISANQELELKEYRTHKILAELYERQERWKESQIQFKKYHELKDAVLSHEARRRADYLEHKKQIAERDTQLNVERATVKATQKVLHQVLPASIADRLVMGEKVADYFSSVSILFADIVGFTPIASRMSAREVLDFLNFVFGEFDRIVQKHGCEKIKTIGDGYLAVAGAPIECSDHAERMTRVALEMMNDIQLTDEIRTSLPKGVQFNIRIGMHTGSCFGGIVGENRFVYDIYSDAVNLAARMESHGKAGRIHISDEFCFHLQNRMAATAEDFGGIRFEEREEMEIKGKGMMRTYFLEKV